MVIPLGMQQYMLLQRNLIYTGITRGKKLVVVVGQRKALAIAVRNNKTEQRFSGLPASGEAFCFASASLPGTATRPDAPTISTLKKFPYGIDQVAVFLQKEFRGRRRSEDDNAVARMARETRARISRP